jgi:hypothetical protein
VTLRRVILAVCAAAAGLACAPVPGDGRFVHIDTEEALIVWDEAAQRQHFIRRASFETDAKDFGFLVPTPAKPELAEADDRVFRELAAITAPALRQAAKGEMAPKSVPAAAPSAVTLLEQKIVAGLDAAVLEASDAKALDGWLKAHGYPSSPELVAWYEPYIARKWKITAFKVAAGAPKLATAAVRMSFQTEKPFFPYREPAVRQAPGTAPRDRLLRVYFLADARFGGTIGDKAPWPGTAMWSSVIEPAQLAQLFKLAKLPSHAGGGGRRLTEFEDRSSPRPGTDEVFFQRAADQSALERPALYGGQSSLALLVELLAAIVVILGGIWFLVRRSRG